MRGDVAAPARHGRLLGSRERVVGRLDEGDLEAIDLVAQQRQHRRQQRDRDGDAREHRQRRANAHLGDEIEPDRGEADDGDRDGRAGEDHSTAGGRGGHRGGLLRRGAVVQRLAEAREDEQRVVDTHAEADHRGEDRCDRVEVGEARGDRQDRDAECHREDCEEDRDQCRQQRAKDDQQDDDGDADTDQLGGTLLWLLLHGLTGVGDPNGTPRRGLRRGVLEVGDHVGGQVPALAVELHVNEADVALRRDRATLAREWIACARHVVDGLGSRDDLLDGRLVLRVSQLAIRVEDDRGRVASTGRELLLQEISRLLRVGVRDRELVLQLATDGAGSGEDPDDDQHPDADRAPRMRSDRAGQAGEEAGLGGRRSCGHRGLLRKSRGARCRTANGHKCAVSASTLAPMQGFPTTSIAALPRCAMASGRSRRPHIGVTRSDIIGPGRHSGRPGRRS